MARTGGRPSADEPRLVLVDGRSLQGALALGTASGTMPTSVMLSRLLAVVPPQATTELLLDGFPSGGVVGRVGPRVRIEFCRHKTADQRIAELVEAAALELGPIGVAGVLVVSDDREVQDVARRHGAAVAGTAWVADGRAASARSAARGPQPFPVTRAARAGTSLGHGRQPRPPRRDRDSR
ncbi:MAG TPA: hypothetical protein VKR30_10830 [Candidatus Limnocylindrales bacterium]|nr:hypothetical protein [Candidatus Limnocylindrales bacterium]